jgi:hypothetical protein
LRDCEFTYQKQNWLFENLMFYFDTLYYNILENKFSNNYFIKFLKSYEVFLFIFLINLAVEYPFSVSSFVGLIENKQHYN